MTTSLFKLPDGEMTEFKGRLSRAGLTTEMARQINGDKNNGLAKVAIAAIENELAKADLNPFRISVEETLSRLRRANKEESWGIEESVIDALADTALEWPEGKWAFRSLRIRFGSGTKGVAKTFEANTNRIESVFGSRFSRWEYLRSDKKHLRLLEGNETHKPTVEWCLIDLDANRRKRGSITAVRGPQSLADEGLVFAWLFPVYVQPIDYKENSMFFLAGYELNVSGCGYKSWYGVPCVRRNLGASEVDLGWSWCSDDHPDYSVPFLRE